MNKTVLIIGGYGNTGRWIAELLLTVTEVQVVIAGRSEEKAKTLASELQRRFPGKQVTGIRVDVADLTGLFQVFKTVNLVVVAASTTALVENVARAAIKARIDYLDTQLSSPAKLKTLRQLEDEIKQAGCCFITDGGFHPGLPAVLVRYAARQLDSITQANVASVIQINWASLAVSEETKIEFVQELKDYQLLVWRQGQWLELAWSKAVKSFDFGHLWGKRVCMPMFLEELRSLPNQIPTLQETGFFVAGFHWWVDYVIMPLSLILLKFSTKMAKPLGQLLWWSLVKTSKPPFGTTLLLEAIGQREGQPQTLQVQLFDEDAYRLTAAPVVACLLQYLEGSIDRPGLWWQGNVVEPVKMLQDLQKLGIKVEDRYYRCL